jgi:hypothetical protein
MKNDRRVRGVTGDGDIPANDASPAVDTIARDAHREPAPAFLTEKVETSPAFDRWLERQMQTLFAACEEPADPKLLELIRKAFPTDKVNDRIGNQGKVTE